MSTFRFHLYMYEYGHGLSSYPQMMQWLFFLSSLRLLGHAFLYDPDCKVAMVLFPLDMTPKTKACKCSPSLPLTFQWWKISFLLYQGCWEMSQVW